ncbi:uncharacterized protein LOC130912772 [Corythoichthys intestinalis]|uniref:uncharacterized protein LOC130912772 n=1 Tax=Corythoichthys intestinalis TaxID=161448 RepID=UPI0025A65493|nr:uncharacterized protein LOC130912772 [Corythoichthys intestinalis]
MAVISIMSDEQIGKYITSYGDRVATLSFCQQKMSSNNKETLLQRLRDKISSKKKGVPGGSSTVPQNGGQGTATARQKQVSAEKTCRKIETGWLHFDNNEYYQVKTKDGGGTRHATIEKTTTAAQILELGKELFFPDGISSKGEVGDFTFEVCDFKRKEISLDETVGRLYEKTKLRLLRFYICTKELVSTSQVDCDDPLPVSMSEGALSQWMGEEDHAYTCVRNHENSSDSDRHEENLHLKPRFKKPRGISETGRANWEEISQPSSSTHTANRETDIGQGHDTNTNDTVWVNLPNSNDFPDPSFEIIDLTRVINDDLTQTETEIIFHDTFDEADTVVWDPDDKLGGFDGGDDESVLTFRNAEKNGETVQALQLPLPSANDFPSQVAQSIHCEAMQVAQESGPNLSLQDLPSDLDSYLSSSSSPDNEGNPKRTRHASICRIKVVDDLLSVFMDSGIMKFNLTFNLVNESGVDDAGVSREVYTAFWEQFLEHCEGETERVPRLRPDFCEAEWQAVGRIWVKGLLDHGVIPVRLSKAFILACIHGIDSVDVDVQMSSFLNYLPPTERSAVEKCLQGTMEESDDEDLLDLFTRMGSHILPPKNSLQPAIETMAHKALLQEPKYIVDCFSSPMVLVYQKLPDKGSVLSLYDSKKATGKRLLQLFQTTKVVLSQVEPLTLSYLQRYVKNADQTKAEKILRFWTGSSVICVDKIMVCFNGETGLNRQWRS